MRQVLVVVAGLAALGFSAFGAHAENTLSHIKSEGVAHIGFADEAPWSYSQPSGTIVGVDYDLASLVFKKLGVSKLDGVLTKFGSLVPGLKAHRYDAIVAGFYIRPARCKQVSFSIPTIAVGDAIVVRAGNPKNIHSYASVIADPSIKLAGIVGASTAKNATAAGVPDDQILMFSDFVSAIAAVKSGRVDGALETSITAQTTVKSSNDPSIEVAHPFKQPVIEGKKRLNYAGFAFRKGDKKLVDAFDAKLRKIIGSPAHLKILAKYGISKEAVPHGVNLADLCKE